MKIKKIFCLLIFVFLSNILFAQSSGYSDYVPAIPDGRRVDWRNAGYDGVIPTYYDAVYEVTNYGAVPDDGSDDAQAIDTTIDHARSFIQTNPGAFAVVYFPEGTYNFSSGINLTNTSSFDYSNIILKGAGSDKTRLLFSNYYTGIAIEINSIQTSSFQEIYSGFYRGDNIIYTNTSGFNVGDYVEIIDDFPLEFGNRGQVEKITGKTGTQLILEDKLVIDYDYGSNHPQIRKIVPIKNAGIEDLEIERVNRTGLYNNTVQFTYSANCWMYDVESYIAYKHHVDINKSTHLEIRGSYFHHATCHGNGGAGYGILIEDHSTDCLVEDNQFDGLRHSMIVQSGANRNVFGYNYSWNREWDSGTADPLVGTGDISVHGNYPYANLFEGNKVELIWADDSHPIMNGPYNTFIRNDVAANIIYLNQADYSNVVGNYVYEVDYDGGPDAFPPFYYPEGSNYVLDVATKHVCIYKKETVFYLHY